MVVDLILFVYPVEEHNVGMNLLLLRLHQFQLIHANVGGKHTVIHHGLAFLQSVNAAYGLTVH